MGAIPPSWRPTGVFNDQTAEVVTDRGLSLANRNVFAAGRPLAMKRILKGFIDRAIENAAKYITPPSAVGQIPIRWGSCGESG
jgi:hypothetical protein